MSLVGKRAAIAATLSTVPDVTGYKFRPSTPRTGDGWSQWRGSNRDGSTGQFRETWAVYVQLPADDVAAERWTDEHRDALWDAVEAEGWILSFEPVDIGRDGRPWVPAIMITMESE